MIHFVSTKAMLMFALLSSAAYASDEPTEEDKREMLYDRRENPGTTRVDFINVDTGLPELREELQAHTGQRLETLEEYEKMAEFYAASEAVLAEIDQGKARENALKKHKNKHRETKIHGVRVKLRGMKVTKAKYNYNDRTGKLVGKQGNKYKVALEDGGEILLIDGKQMKILTMTSTQEPTPVVSKPATQCHVPPPRMPSGSPPARKASREEVTRTRSIPAPRMPSGNPPPRKAPRKDSEATRRTPPVGSSLSGTSSLFCPQCRSIPPKGVNQKKGNICGRLTHNANGKIIICNGKLEKRKPGRRRQIPPPPPTGTGQSPPEPTSSTMPNQGGRRSSEFSRFGKRIPPPPPLPHKQTEETDQSPACNPPAMPKPKPPTRTPSPKAQPTKKKSSRKSTRKKSELFKKMAKMINLRQVKPTGTSKSKEENVPLPRPFFSKPPAPKRRRRTRPSTN